MSIRFEWTFFFAFAFTNKALTNASKGNDVSLQYAKANNAYGPGQFFCVR
jgi:hypothetical protein